MKKYLITYFKENKIFLLCCYLFLTSIFWYSLFILFLSVQTIKTFILWLIVLSILIIPIIFLIKFKINKIYLLLSIISLFIILWFGFQKNEWTHNNFSLVCIKPCDQYYWNLLNILTEKELLNMWFKSAWFFSINNTTLDSFKNTVLKIEEEIDINLPSQIPKSILDNVDEKQYFVYIPENSDKDKIIIFLHWSAWWFIFYQKLFKQFADNQWIIIVSPNFWWWNWNNYWWTNLVWDVYNNLLNKEIINKNTEIILMWASNGWRWLTRLISEDENNIFSKIVFISPIIEYKITNYKSFQKNIKDKKILIIHWKKDVRIPFSHIEEFTNENNNIDLDTLIFNEWNHFILGTESEAIQEKLKEFIWK